MPFDGSLEKFQWLLALGGDYLPHHHPEDSNSRSSLLPRLVPPGICLVAFSFLPAAVEENNKFQIPFARDYSTPESLSRPLKNKTDLLQLVALQLVALQSRKNEKT
ncbi:unnamed protein product [Linum trigynum]|uniref:Uncharacterized protein n=1 Tax=Linum trigynum TaxID=586398 RepID=A0AAV2F2F7_9ROSI